MLGIQGAFEYREDFHGAGGFPVGVNTAPTPANGTRWGYKRTAAAGSPTWAPVSDDFGAVKALLTNTNETQNITLYHIDVLGFALRPGLEFECGLRFPAAFGANTKFVAGLCSAQNDDEQACTYLAAFKIAAAAMAVTLEIDDNAANDVSQSQIEGSLDITGKLNHFQINFGNLKQIGFQLNGRPLARGVNLDLSAIEGQKLQPFFMLAKTSAGTQTDATLLDYLRIAGNRV